MGVTSDGLVSYPAKKAILPSPYQGNFQSIFAVIVGHKLREYYNMPIVMYFNNIFNFYS